jgi:hypothetical protein
MLGVVTVNRSMGCLLGGTPPSCSVYNDSFNSWSHASDDIARFCRSKIRWGVLQLGITLEHCMVVQ